MIAQRFSEVVKDLNAAALEMRGNPTTYRACRQAALRCCCSRAAAAELVRPCTCGGGTLVSYGLPTSAYEDEGDGMYSPGRSVVDEKLLAELYKDDTLALPRAEARAPDDTVLAG